MPPVRRAMTRPFLASLLSALVLGTLLPATTFAGVDDDFPPAAHWAFDGGAGTDVVDSGAGGHDGVASGTEWIDGKVGGALRFSGTDRVAVPGSASLSPNPHLAVAMWVRSASPTVTNARTILSGQGGACASSFLVSQFEAGIGFYVGSGTDSSVSLGINGLPGGGSLWDGAWHHVMFQVGTTTAAYLDGVPVQVGQPTTAPLGKAFDDDSLLIGQHQDCESFGGYIGDLDDVRLYTGSAFPSPTQIAPQLLDEPIATTTSLEASATSVAHDEELWLRGTVAPNPGGGTMVFERLVASSWITAATRPVGPNGMSSTYEIAGHSLEIGQHQYRAWYQGAGVYAASTPSTPSVITKTKIPTTTTVTVSPTINYPGAPTALTAVVTDCDPSGMVKFFRIVDGASVQIGLDDDLLSCQASAQVTGLPIGSHQLYAIYYGSATTAVSTSAKRTHKVAKMPTIPAWDPTPTTVIEHDPLRLLVIMEPNTHPGAPSPPPAPTGTWTFKRTTGGVTSVIATRPGGASAELVTSALPAGTHAVTATYSGDAVYAGSTTPSLQVVVQPDHVQAGAFAMQYPTFYPIVDGYRDTVGIKGRLDEPASVEITIRNANGTLVRTYTLGRRTGAYSQAWSGKNSSGTLLAAGTYAIRQVVKDDHGNTLTWSGSVVLSRKKLVEKTGSKTRYANEYAALGREGTTTLAKSTIFTNGLRIQTRSVGGYVALGYEFTLPTAPVYVSMQLRVYGKGGGTAVFGLQDFTLPGWDPGDDWWIEAFDPVVSTSTNARWNPLSADLSRHRDGRTVRAMVKSTTQPYDVFKVQLLYTYKVLQ